MLWIYFAQLCSPKTGLPEAHTGSPVELPLLSLHYVRPVDGLPLLHHWVMVLKDLIFNGFENWREMFEVKVIDEMTVAGSKLGFATCHAVKGLGRLSVIWWCILRTYYDRDSLTDQQKESFGRLGI